MKLNQLLYRVTGAAMLTLFALTAHANDCTTPAAGDFYVDKDNGGSDSNNGHYTKDGGTGPFKTIQKLVDTLQAGQCGFVRQSSTPYYENTWRNGDYSGITFSKGGTSDTNRIIVAGYPGERPVVDQNRAAATKGYSLTGFFVYGGSYITIRNFEVRNTTASGISMNPSATTSYVNVEGNHVHNVVGNGNPDNRGGIRIDYCDYCNIRNNIIHDSGDDDGADGINGFQPGNTVVENNLIYNVALGVQLKQADTNHLNALTVRNNIFVNINDAAYKMQLQGAGMPAPRNSLFYNNVVYNARVGVWADLAEASEQAAGLKIYNNTFYKSGNIANIANFTGIEVYNNIYSDWTNSYSSMESFIFSTVKAASWVNSIGYFNYQLYFNASPKWEIETYNSPLTLSSLLSWQSVTRDVTSPDMASKFADPMFNVSAPASAKVLAGDVSDFGLKSGSPGLNAGRNGETIGAVRSGVSIGPSGVAISTAPKPNPPTSVTVQ